MGGGSRGRAETQETQQGRQLPSDRGGRVFQNGLGHTHEAKDGTPDVQGFGDSLQNQQENASKTSDGRRERILQQTRDQSVERSQRASFFHGGRYQSQRGGTI